MKYSYFPGCSLHSTGVEYDLSTRALFQYLNMELEELPDWNCCGASSAHALDHRLALDLPARNLSIAQSSAHDLVVPCAACFNRMKNIDRLMHDDPETRVRLEKEVGFTYTGEVAIRPVLAVMYEDVGLDRLRALVRRPLTGMKLVPYYGCLLVRPPQVVQFDDPDNPRIMSALLRAVGAEVMDWSHACDCCGGSLSLSRKDVVEGLVGRLVERAREAGGEALVTACPLCQVNLEMRQTSLGMPVFYFTELLCLALGLPESKRWWKRHLIRPQALLQQLGLVE